MSAKHVNCIACYHLQREVYKMFSGVEEVYFNCGKGRFPYASALSGLLRPGKGVSAAARDCPELDMERCLVCGKKKEHGLSHDPELGLCMKHYWDWATWLDKHPERRDYFVPGQRAIKSRWLEVFWEFIASARGKMKS